MSPQQPFHELVVLHVPRHRALNPQDYCCPQEDNLCENASVQISENAEHFETFRRCQAAKLRVDHRGTAARHSHSSVVIKMKLAGRPTGELKFEFVQGKTACTTAYAR